MLAQAIYGVMSPICRPCRSTDIPRDEFAGRGDRTAALDPGAVAWLVQSTKRTRSLEKSSVIVVVDLQPEPLHFELCFRSKSSLPKQAEPAYLPPFSRGQPRFACG